jgi:hypothetical protein
LSFELSNRRGRLLSKHVIVTRLAIAVRFRRHFLADFAAVLGMLQARTAAGIHI